MSITSFLYRYLCRGIGMVILIGMITILVLAIRWQIVSVERERSHPAATGHPVPRLEGSLP